MHQQIVLHLIIFSVFSLIALNALTYYARRLTVLPEIIWILLLGLGYASIAHFGYLDLPELTLSPDIILYVFVPPLVFASTQKMCLSHFKEILFPASLIASVGILISMAVIASVLHFAFTIPWFEALLFGAIISATDPLAVGALLHNNQQVSELKKLLIEGESILNDGFVITVAGIISLILFKGEEFNILSSGTSLITHIVGALIIGFVFGRSARWLLNIWQEKHFTLTVNMTLAIAFGSFILAETFHFSGILAVFSAALAYGYKPNKDNVNKHGHTNIWEYIEYLANAILFFLLGASFFVYTSFEVISVALVLMSFVLLFISRMSALTILFPFIKLEKKKLDINSFWLLNFSGARGAVSIALILLLPDSFAFKPLFLSLAFTMIIFSLIVYPLFMKQLLKA